MISEDPPRHPAKWTDTLLTVISQWLAGSVNVIDNFGGTGKLGAIKGFGFKGRIYINELEKEWQDQALDNGADVLIHGDACAIPYKDSSFDACVTSPVYGNKMSEHCNWKPERVCHTYKSYIGRALAENNAGRFYFGSSEYADIHWRAWLEVRRLLKHGGKLIVNTSNFIKLGKEIDVTGWHHSALTRLGFTETRRLNVDTPRNRHGLNGDKRVDHETLIEYVLDKSVPL